MYFEVQKDYQGERFSQCQSNYPGRSIDASSAALLLAFIRLYTCSEHIEQRQRIIRPGQAKVRCQCMHKQAAAYSLAFEFSLGNYQFSCSPVSFFLFSPVQISIHNFLMPAATAQDNNSQLTPTLFSLQQRALPYELQATLLFRVNLFGWIYSFSVTIGIFCFL